MFSRKFMEPVRKQDAVFGLAVTKRLVVFYLYLYI
ncbi:hypothetical protein V6Z12_A02G086500 [Gossypium hirsutum]